MDWARSADKDDFRQFMNWVAEYDVDLFKQLRTGGQVENPIMAAMDAGLDWKEIAEDFLEQKPVNYYPGDRGPED